MKTTLVVTKEGVGLNVLAYLSLPFMALWIYGFMDLFSLQ
jgi:hypothetical protein